MIDDADRHHVSDWPFVNRSVGASPLGSGDTSSPDLPSPPFERPCSRRSTRRHATATATTPTRAMPSRRSSRCQLRTRTSGLVIIDGPWNAELADTASTDDGPSSAGPSTADQSMPTPTCAEATDPTPTEGYSCTDSATGAGVGYDGTAGVDDLGHHAHPVRPFQRTLKSRHVTPTPERTVLCTDSGRRPRAWPLSTCGVEPAVERNGG